MINVYKTAFLSQYPHSIYLSLDDIDQVKHFLISEKLIDYIDDIISISKAGEGNMNFVLRVVTKNRTLIVKQSRPWVEKYPHIKAPIERIGIETKFYTEVSRWPSIAKYMPKYLGQKTSDFILVIEDVGECKDFMHIYQDGSSLSIESIDSLIHFLTELHKLEINDFPTNRNMRLLNHEHIYQFPFRANNGLDLDAIQPGLQSLALSFSEKTSLVGKIHMLGQMYLEERKGSLIHGDFYPGSWLHTYNDIKIIDPEFCFVGSPAFDLGVMIGHMMLSQHSEHAIENTINTYVNTAPISKDEVYAHAAVEVLRRILGVAQLPLTLNIEEKSFLCKKVESMI